MKDSLYDIPDGCICVGDGLFGMKCDATTHAKLKPTSPYWQCPNDESHSLKFKYRVIENYSMVCTVCNCDAVFKPKEATS